MATKIIEKKITMETTKTAFQNGGYKTSIPKKIAEFLDLDVSDTLVWVIGDGKLVSVSSLKDVVDRNKLTITQTIRET